MYFEKAGQENTKDTARLATEKAQKEGIRYLVVASNTGATADYFLDSGLNVVCVTHQIGFRNPGEDEMEENKREKLKASGVNVLTTSHFMGGVGRAVRKKHGGLYPGEIMADSLRILGQGVKVGVEISVMALDAGMIPYGEDIIAVGGTGRGADTALVIRPEHGHHIFASRIKEIICKPKE